MIEYVCPACRTPVTRQGERYHCSGCGRLYPVLFGIPDFRLRPDRYLSLDEERAKAARLHAFGQTTSFDALIDFYYAITDDVTGARTAAFARYVREAPERGRATLATLPPLGEGDALLDLGCGSGGALLAASNGGARVIGVDIGLRWLVIAQRRLAEAGANVALVCADMEALPFSAQTFSHVLAEDVVEHAYSPLDAVAAAARQVAPGGSLFVSAINRHWIGPHPAVGLWAAGLLPRGLRSRLLRARDGVDSLRNMGFVSPGEVIRAARKAGLGLRQARPRSLAARFAGGPALLRRIGAAHEWCRTAPLTAPLLLRAGPTFEVVLRHEGKGGKLA